MSKNEILTRPSPAAAQKESHPELVGPVSIHRVPAEIWQHIFMQWKDDELRILHKIANLDRNLLYPWLAVTSVCRTWYTAGTECAALWSIFLIPPISSLAFFEMSLRRSKKTRLVVIFADRRWSFRTAGPPEWEMLSRLLEEPDRVHELSATFDWPLKLPKLYEQLLMVGSQLQRFSFTTYSFGPQTLPSHAPDSLTFPFPGQHFPVLRSLSFRSNLVFSWDHIRNLKTLVTLHVHTERELPVALCHLMECLADLSALQELRLVDIKLTRHADHPIRLASLRTLRQCELAASPADCSAILDHLALSPTAFIFISYDFELEFHPLATLLTPILPKITASGSPQIISFSLEVDLDGWRGCSAWSTQLPLETVEIAADSRICRVLASNSPYHDIPFLAATFPLQDVHTLVIKCSWPFYSLSDLHEIQATVASSWAPRFPSVRELRIWLPRNRFLRADYSLVVEIFCGTSTLSRTTSKPTTPAWPLLETLVLYDITDRCGEGKAWDACILKIRDTLLQREEVGSHRLSRLVIPFEPQDRLLGVTTAGLSPLLGCADEVSIILESAQNSWHAL